MLLDLPDKCGGADKSAEVFLLLVIKSSPGNTTVERCCVKPGLKRGYTMVCGSGGSLSQGPQILVLRKRDLTQFSKWSNILFLEWMERNCPNARFLLNGDDYVFAHTNNMVEYLQGLKDNDGSKHLFAGHLIAGKGPVGKKKNKYYIPVQVEESESYPSYCGGGGFLLSGYTAMVITKSCFCALGLLDCACLQQVEYRA
ncbi:hypothetical protein F7725_027806 [Dissostichus mawsoni]|uniref:Hexosyltransferase n=1 Tax=Dissostichus mawsoni TaxID=36200 RepID=A0A7J5XGA1_DISMA|nr:hypothetical protein F7725_027806 [Dissostichus mawsoni]